MSLSSKDTLRLDQLRRAAKTLKKSYDAGDAGAVQVVQNLWGKSPGTHADFLHVIARQHGFMSWPRLKWAAETIGLERAEAQEQLKMALFNGNRAAAEALLAATPDLAAGNMGLLCATFDLEGLTAALCEDPARAIEPVGPRRPILHLAFSKWGRMGGEEAASLACAEVLLAHGADVNDAFPHSPGTDEMLSALYGALGHARNLPLAEWLLEWGADPNDGESLYHATELGDAAGVRLLLRYGANPQGTNALLRAMDFDNAEMVALLLGAGADPNESAQPGYNALHHAALRGAGREVSEFVLNAGASVTSEHAALKPHAFARLVGAEAVRAVLETVDAPRDVPADLAPLVNGGGEGFVDPAKIPAELQGLLTELVHRVGTLKRIKSLVEVGFPWDAPDSMGVTPVQASGWVGLPEYLRYFLKLGPDLSHLNDFGGSLLGTILHGSENAPERSGQDHLACLEIVLTHGVALPRRALSAQLRPDVAEFLRKWAKAHPGQVVEHGVY
ncbi:ankyrin repeat domain-containing protein [Shimia ponticola]|uniref:ankyrin repeat domain-containing protein n=1 Tax=Shimia ponticola TaxID=2582893 RepID=UPI00164BF933|nr:ankyrin repeat domain-containing protein [Shimia ponticola]